MNCKSITCSHPSFIERNISFDFGEFWVGATEGKSRKNKHRWLGGFSGRPNLSDELFPTIKALFSNMRPSKIRGARTELRQFFRFLDSYETWLDSETTNETNVSRIDCIRDITVIHGLRWLNAPNNAPWPNAKVDAYRSVIKVLNYTRVRLGYAGIWMPSVGNRDPVNRDDVPSEEQGKIVVAELSKRTKLIWDRWDRADYLASIGRNLLTIPRNPKNNFKSVQVWNFEVTEADLHTTYRAFVNETGNPLINLKMFLSRLGYKSRGIPISWWPQYPVGHPNENNYIAFLDIQFGMYPSAEDLNILLLLFMARSGWNPSTTLSLDVSNKNNWAANYSEKLAWIYSHKARGNTLQDTMSWVKQKTGCYQIVNRMFERTGTLRSLIEREPHRSNHPLIAAKSPWLAASQNTNIPAVYVLEESSNGRYNVLNKLIAQYNANQIDNSKKLPKFKPTDFRDVFASAIYRDSGYSIVMTQIALGHKYSGSTYNYLKSRAWRSESEKKKNDLVTAVFDQIEVHKKIDYTLLRAKMDGISVSDEDFARLESYRVNMTYSGVGCTTPKSPPVYIDPTNPQDGNTACAQGHRCPACPRAKVFNDSLPLLSRRLAELYWLRDSNAGVKWEMSSEKNDLLIFEATLKQWVQAEVDKYLKFWIEKIQSGEHRVIRFGGVH